jgi:hypothetical protein
VNLVWIIGKQTDIFQLEILQDGISDTIGATIGWVIQQYISRYSIVTEILQVVSPTVQVKLI